VALSPLPAGLCMGTTDFASFPRSYGAKPQVGLKGHGTF
jgi:hypothetical protein